MRKLAACLLLATLGVAGIGAGAAQADPIDPSASHPARTWRPARHAARTWHPTTYRVKKGDHQWTRIAKANHIHGTLVRPGQVLRIPR